VSTAASAAQASTTASAPSQTPGKRLIIPAGGRGGWLSPGILVGNTLYMSGQLPAGNLRDSSIAAQTRSVIERTKPILEAAGMTLADVVSIQAYLVDMADYNGFNTVYREYFTAEPPPTRTTVIVKELVQGAKLELTMVAVK
jgi:reactive intermediate/imine deaminase